LYLPYYASLGCLNLDLAERIDLLTRAVDLSEGRIPDDVGVQARAVVERLIVPPGKARDPERPPV
jgi:hypothetical protein